MVQAKVSNSKARALLQALNTASLEAVKVRAPEQVYPAAAAALRKLGYHVNIYAADADGQARLAHHTYARELVLRVEQMTGLSHRAFVVDPDKVPLFRAVLRQRETRFVSDTISVLEHIVPTGSKAVARMVARLLGIGKLIAAPIQSEDEVKGMLIVLSNGVDAEDVPGVEAFAHLLGRMLARVELLSQLQQSVRELEETQTYLVHARKLEAVGRLTAGIAHDFNNLLTPALLSVDMLRTERDEASRSEALNTLAAALDRAARLTRQLLAFGRKQVLSKERVDVRDLVEETAAMLASMLGHEVRCELRLEAEGAVVLADRGQLEQVLLNLALNARDAMAPGGLLTIGTREAMRRLPGHAENEDPRAVVLFVEDDGAGMSAEVLEHAFEPFFTTKARGTGTGLGLAVVHGIIEQHGGMTNIDSAPSQGTRVEVWFPESHGIELPRASRRRSDSVTLNGVVWVLEDNHDIRRLVAGALRARGARVAEAATVGQARELLAGDGKPLLLVSDVVLPDGNGAEFAAELHEAVPSAAVLLVSGHPLDDERARRVSEVRDAYLAKPFTLFELSAAVDDALRACAARR